MKSNEEVYAPTDLVLFVWPRQSELELRAGGQRTRQDAASNAWAMDKNKAERVRVIVSIYDDEIIGAWSVQSHTTETATPVGKSRNVTRAKFDTHEDPRLSYLIGRKSQLPRRRNPQTTIELRDLDGSAVLFENHVHHDEPRHGVIRLGSFTLTVREDGTADLAYPASAPVTLRPIA